MYEVQKELYVYLDSLEDLKHYAEKKKRIDAEIEKAEEEQMCIRDRCVNVRWL